jgi:hypothetical protein
MPKFTSAVTDLIVQASSPDATPQSVQEAVRTVCGAIGKSNRQTLDEGLTRLSDSIASAEMPGAAIVAICCGAIVESGGNPELVIDSTLSRLGETMMAAQLYAEACEEAAADDEDEADNTDDEDDEDDPIERFGPAVAERMPENAKAFEALEPLCMGAVSMLSHSQRGRKQAREQHPNLPALADDLAPYHERVLLLARILNVLDEERIVVLHPTEKKGYRVRMSGVGTNVELFILLGDALIGDPAESWLSGKKPDPAVAAACRDQPADTVKGKTATGAFNLYNWKALLPDGTLPDPKDYASSKDWIWMEGIPSDIQKYEGQRIVLLGPPPYARVLRPGRCFEGMVASVLVESKMTLEEVEELLKKLVNAKR